MFLECMKFYQPFSGDAPLCDFQRLSQAPSGQPLGLDQMHVIDGELTCCVLGDLVKGKELM